MRTTSFLVAAGAVLALAGAATGTYTTLSGGQSRPATPPGAVRVQHVDDNGQMPTSPEPSGGISPGVSGFSLQQEPIDHGITVENNAFVPVKIMPPTRSNRQIVVQPAVGYDPSFDFGSAPLTPSGTSSSTGPVTTFSTPKLTH